MELRLVRSTKEHGKNMLISVNQVHLLGCKGCSKDLEKIFNGFLLPGNMSIILMMALCFQIGKSKITSVQIAFTVWRPYVCYYFYYSTLYFILSLTLICDALITSMFAIVYIYPYRTQSPTIALFSCLH